MKEKNWLKLLEEDLEDFLLGSSDDKSEEKEIIKHYNLNEVNVSYDLNNTEISIDKNKNKQK